MGEAVGKIYVAKHFPPEAKARMNELVANLIEAYREDIHSLDWMSPETQARRSRSSPSSPPRSAIPTSGATTRRSRSAATTCSATSAGRLRSRSTATSPSSASRSTATSGA